jgi:hypothetical protein
MSWARQELAGGVGDFCCVREGDAPMKPALALTLLLLTVQTTAHATYAPVAPQRLTPPPEESAMLVGPAGAMLESDYFRAPPAPIAARRVFPCRLQISVFDKTRLAQSCN